MNQKPTQNTPKVNRALYIITVTLLLAVAVAIAVTSAANRRAKPPVSEDTTYERETETETETQKETETAKPEDTSSEKVTDAPKPPPARETKPTPTVEEPVVEANTIPDSFILPVSGILSKGHSTELQVFSLTMNDYRVHSGIDIVCAENTPVHAAADGTVDKIWEDPLMGNSIAVSHSGNCYTVYKNLSGELAAGIEEGAKVNAGQLIASVGSTAMIELAEEPHLHFEMTVDGKPADPLKYFDTAALSSLGTDTSYES